MFGSCRAGLREDFGAFCKLFRIHIYMGTFILPYRSHLSSATTLRNAENAKNIEQKYQRLDACQTLDVLIGLVLNRTYLSFQRRIWFMTSEKRQYAIPAKYSEMCLIDIASLLDMSSSQRMLQELCTFLLLTTSVESSVPTIRTLGTCVSRHSNLLSQHKHNTRFVWKHERYCEWEESLCNGTIIFNIRTFYWQLKIFLRVYHILYT